MATWDDLSTEALRAANVLKKEGCYRGCVNRAYYSVYCAAAGRVVGKGVKFRHGWQNPAHEQLPGLILARYAKVSETGRWELVKVLRRLRFVRTDADYRPRATVDETLARNALRDASYFLKTIERLL
jgi:uncharacterized protein (UPF0332 family)